MRFNICVRILLVFAGLTQICKGQPAGKKELDRRLDQEFSRIFSPDEPGGSIFIQHDRTILYKKSFGLSDIITRQKFSSATVANLGSISKTFVAYAILQLQNAGKLSLGDNLYKYFPDFRNRQIAEKVTIRHLMSHTSGLPDSRQTDRDSIFYLTAKDAENFEPLKSTEALEFEPGSQWMYSNPAYNGLALIIEKVTGLKWQQYVQHQILQPSGMHNSKITDGSYPEKNVAHGYRKLNNRFEEYDYGEYPTFCAAGNGGIWSSVDELRKYADAIAGSKFLDPATIEAAKKVWQPENWSGSVPMTHTTVWFRHPGLRAYAAGLGRFEVIEHSGDQGGFRAHIIWVPAQKITIIWITNNELYLTDIIGKHLMELNYLKN